MEDARKDWADQIKEIGGLVAVIVGIVAVAGIAAGAFIVNSDTATALAGSTIAVIGSIVGAYFGVKIGSDQTRNAIEAQREEAAKAQVYAAHTSESDADAIVQRATEAVQTLRRS
jgi:uncharacterized protein YacL